MYAFERTNRSLHSLYVERLRNVQCPRAQERYPPRLIENVVAVVPAPCTKSRVKFRWNFAHFPHCHIIWKQSVERPLDRCEAMPRSRLRVGDLPPRMHPRVRTPGEIPANSLACKDGPAPFELALNSARVTLKLRSRESGAIVFKRKRDVSRCSRLRLRACLALYQLDHDHFSRVALAWTELGQPDIPAGAIGIAGSNLQQAMGCALRSAELH